MTAVAFLILAVALLAVATFLEVIDADAGASLCHHAASFALGAAAALAFA